MPERGNIKESSEKKKKHPAAKKNWKWKTLFTFRAAMLNFPPFLETQRIEHKEILVPKDDVTDSFQKIEETGASCHFFFFFFFTPLNISQCSQVLYTYTFMS